MLALFVAIASMLILIYFGVLAMAVVLIGALPTDSNLKFSAPLTEPRTKQLRPS